MKRHSWFPCLVVLTQSLFAQQPADKIPPRSVSGYIDADGTAYITRIVNVPETISAEAQKSLVAQHNLPPQEHRGRQLRQMSSDTIRALYPANVEFSTIAGVPVSVVTPLSIPSNKTDRVLINLHGGGFTSDSGSLTESMPIANLTKIKVISVMYRLAPGYKFPAPVEDVVAVYRELLKTYRAQHIAIYGSSAGAVSLRRLLSNSSNLACHCLERSAYSRAGATSQETATPNRFTVCRGFLVIPTLGRRECSGLACMWVRPTPKTPCYPQFLPTCTECRPPYL